MVWQVAPVPSGELPSKFAFIPKNELTPEPWTVKPGVVVTLAPSSIYPPAIPAAPGSEPARGQVRSQGAPSQRVIVRNLNTEALSGSEQERPAEKVVPAGQPMRVRLLKTETPADRRILGQQAYGYALRPAVYRLASESTPVPWVRVSADSNSPRTTMVLAFKKARTTVTVPDVMPTYEP
jgi:hypothetical protein